MLQIKTKDEIYGDILGNIPGEYEKSTGFLTADLAKANSIEFEKIYKAIEVLADKNDVDKIEGDELAKFVWQRKGIIKTKATFAKVDLTVTGTGRIRKGDLFSTKNNILFASEEDKDINVTGIIKAVCLKSGTVGMVGANSIVQFPITISGFVSVTNANPSRDGFEQESDKSLRDRYYSSLRKNATSGNKYHYEQWSNEIAGTGKAKVFPLWNGDNTVKVMIIDDNMQPASLSLIDEVQKYIDPKGEYDSEANTWRTWGNGLGQAPMGAYCTVDSAKGKGINISVDVNLANGYILEQVKMEIEEKLAEYLKEIAFSDIFNYVSCARIGAIILGVPGVIDYVGLLVNGSATENVQIGEDEVAVLGTVVVS